MSSDDERDDHVYYGTALEPLEEDAVVRKKPVALQDQIVTDEHGRRRFHGAFTGGFSAGYYNSVGSKEGWKPSSFKSTRANRTSAKEQSAEDYMDEEDIGAFGIAPKVLRPTDEFTSKKKETTKRSGATTGPIPGDPVLMQIIQPVIETAGIKILRKLGWRPGQGIGPKEKQRSRKKHKSSVEDQNMDVEEEIKFYGCSRPPLDEEGSSNDDGTADSDEENLRNIVAAPKDTNCPVYNPKDNKFGLGYKGLDRNALGSGHVNLFGPSLKFKVDNKSMNIAGEAFGIGVFEDKDEEVYSREDMSEYDFSLETADERKARLRKEAKGRARKRRFSFTIPGYQRAKNTVSTIQFFPPPVLPPDFEPIHRGKKSRFTATAEEEPASQKLGLDRHKYSREERNLLLGDAKPVSVTRVIDLDSTAEKESAQSVQTSQQEAAKLVEDEDNRKRAERLKKFAEVLQQFSTQKPPSTSGQIFKPFVSQPGKQDRYDKYMALKAAGYGECLKDLQPPEMTEWERERERIEFDRASTLYKPLANEISSRFVSAKSHDISHLVPEKENEAKLNPNEDPKVAAKMGMFGKLTHRVQEWHPHNIVCRRFNIPNPYPESKMVGVYPTYTEPPVRERRQEPEEPKKSLFENLDFSKPPPGLYPAQSSSEAPLINTGVGQTSIPSPGESEDTAEFPPIPIVKATEPIVKPPLDLFKEIFAETSESEEEEEPAQKSSTATKPSDTLAPSEKTDSDNKGSGSMKEQPKHIDVPSSLDHSKAKIPTISSSRAPLPADAPKPSVFDNLDFSAVNRTKSDARFEIVDDDEEDSYGPALPKLVRTSAISGPSGAASLATRHIFSKAKAKSSELLRGDDGTVWVEKSADIPSAPKRKHSKKKSKDHRHRHKSKAKKHKSDSSHKKKKKHRKSEKSKKRHRTSSSSTSDSSSSQDSDGTDSDDSPPITKISKTKNAKNMIAVLKEMV